MPEQGILRGCKEIADYFGMNLHHWHRRYRWVLDQYGCIVKMGNGKTSPIWTTKDRIEWFINKYHQDYRDVGVYWEPPEKWRVRAKEWGCENDAKKGQ